MSTEAIRQLTMLEAAVPPKERTRRKLGNAQNTIHYIEQARQTANEQLQYNLANETNMLANLLVQRKKLPNFYFIEEARNSRIPQKTFNSWNIKDWPYRPIKKTEHLRDITLVLLRVRIRLWHYPADETYWDAQKRLIDRVTHLKDTGLTHNQIALAVGKSHSTLSDILSKTEGKRTRHCPWELLDRLDRLEQNEQQLAEDEMAEDRILRRRQQERPEPPSPISIQEMTRQIKAKVILPGDNCLKCGAPWNHLVLTKEKHPGYPEAEYRLCTNCGRENITGEIRPLIERRGACGHCGAQWHHLKRQEERAQDSSLIYLCLNCCDESRVPALHKTAEHQTG